MYVLGVGSRNRDQGGVAGPDDMIRIDETKLNETKQTNYSNEGPPDKSLKMNGMRIGYTDVWVGGWVGWLMGWCQRWPKRKVALYVQTPSRLD